MDDYIYTLYFKDEDAVNRRIIEQIKIGNIEKIEEGYKLTRKGILVTKLMGLITRGFNTKKNYAE